MERKFAAAAGGGRSAHSTVGSLACLLFVLALAVAFWTGALWIAEFIFRFSALR